MGKVMISGVAPQMTKPIPGILLSDIAEGSIVKLNENGSPVEFYVACHNYESSLNGEGRTLLVRKDCYNQRTWNGSRNTYATSLIDTWLNEDYKGLLDADTQTAIGTTKFYYTPGNGNKTVTALERSILLLSMTELGKSDGSSCNVEGSTLPIASLLIPAKLNGNEVSQWTRSPVLNNVVGTYGVLADGRPSSYSASNEIGSRPCFTLPSTAFFDEDTLLFKGAS